MQIQFSVRISGRFSVLDEFSVKWIFGQIFRLERIFGQMAEVTVVPDKVETVVTEAGHVLVKLTHDEAKALRTLLYTGTDAHTLAKLGLSELTNVLRLKGVKSGIPLWSTIANLTSEVES